MGIETVSLIIAAFANAATGVAATLRNFRSRLCVGFALLAGLLFLHDTLSVFENFNPTPSRTLELHTLITLLVGPASLAVLRRIVPRGAPNGLLRKSLERGMWAYAPLFAVTSFLMTLPSYGRWQIWLLVAAHVFLLVPAALWIFALARAQGETALTRERLRFRYALWGGIAALAFFVSDALSFAGFRVPPLGTLARTLYLIFVFQTFVQKELMTDEEVVAKLTLFGGVALTLSSIYWLLVSWVGNQRDLFYFNTLIASFVILILFDPIRKGTARLTRRLFLRRNVLLEDELNRLSSEVMGVLEPAELSRRIGVSLGRALSAEKVALYLLARDGLTYVREDGGDEISASSALIEYSSLRRGRPFVMETVENDRDSYLSPQSRKFCQSCLEMLGRIGADFIVPLDYSDRLIGICAVKTGERVALSNEQLRLFIPVARQIAQLLKNAQVFTSLRDRDKLAAIGEMAAGLAHEIKNPLGAIHGAAQLLKESLAERRGADAEFLGIILDETRRLSGVVSDFLDFAKPRRHQSGASCDPLRIIEHTASMVLRDLPVHLEIASTDDGRPLLLEADPEILKQILLNLFLNAVQAMEGQTETPALKVRVRELSHRRVSSAYLEIQVEDNGPGIPESDLPRVFEPFYTTKAKGTGLGLAITKRLVEEMGGTVSVRSQGVPSPGSTFTLHLPVSREKEVME